MEEKPAAKTAPAKAAAKKEDDDDSSSEEDSSDDDDEDEKPVKKAAPAEEDGGMKIKSNKGKTVDDMKRPTSRSETSRCQRKVARSSSTMWARNSPTKLSRSRLRSMARSRTSSTPAADLPSSHSAPTMRPRLALRAWTTLRLAATQFR